jgi:hypothetical protein
MSTQVKDVTTYSPEELRCFHERFTPLAKQYHARMRKALYVRGVFYFFWLVSGIVVLIPLGQYVFSFWLIGLISSLVCFFRMLPRLPKCPACDCELSLRTGAFCPDCGSRSLYTPVWFGTPQSSKCGACKRSLFTSRKGGKSYRIHACNQCGLMLDKRGF